ncbi:MAG: hypothetical protein HUJ42_00500 [Malacoplasma sp.]|nr:hypothetical protein [Malacoplasma sp.]
MQIVKKFFKFFASLLRSIKTGFVHLFKYFNFSAQLKGGKAFRVIFFFLIYAVSVVGIVFGLLNLGNNNQKRGLFGNSYDVTYKVAIPNNYDEAQAKMLVDNTTQRFAKFLLYKGVVFNNIASETTLNSADNTYTGNIYVSYNDVSTYYDDEFKNSTTKGYYDIDPNRYGLTNGVSNTLSVWYFNPAQTTVRDVYTYSNPSTGTRTNQVLTTTDFNYSSAQTDSRKSGENAQDLNNYGITLKLNGSSYEYLDEAGLSAFKSQASDSNGSTVAKTSDVQWVVFQNIDQLVNLLNYAKYVSMNYHFYSGTATTGFSKETQTKWKIYYDNLKSINSNLVTWADASIGVDSGNNNNVDTNVLSNIGVNAITPQYLMICYEHALGNDTVSTATNYPNIDKDGSSSLLDVVKSYVVGVVSKVNYKQWFPSITSESSTISGTNVSSFSIQPYAYQSNEYTSSSGSDSSSGSSSDSSSSTDAQRKSSQSAFLNTFQNFSLPTNFYTLTQQSSTYTASDLPSIRLSFEQNSDASPSDSNHQNNTLTNAASNNSIQNATRNTSYYFGVNGWVSNPFIENSTIDKISSYNSMFLASGIILLLIGIVVSLIYRVPGVAAAFAIIASFGFSLSLLVVLKIDISISSLLALFIGTIVSIMSVSMVMERVRRLIKQKNSVFDSLQIAIKKSMLSVLDLNVVIMVIGLSIFFIAKGELTTMGITLLLSGLLSLGTSFIYFLLPLYAYSGFQFSWNLRANFWSVSDKLKKHKYNLHFKPKLWSIIWVVVIVLVIIAAIVYGTVGLNHTLYKNGTFMYITLLANNDAQNSVITNSNGLIDAIKTALGNGWDLSFKNVSEYDSGFGNNAVGYYYVIVQGFNANPFTASQIASTLSNSVTSQYSDATLANAILNNISVFDVNQTLLTDMFLSGMYAMLAAFGFLSIYFAIRLNVLTIIPIFITNTLLMLLSVGLSYLFQFNIDILFIYVMLYASTISMCTSVMFISVTKSRMTGKKTFEKEKIQVFILNNIRSLTNLIYLICGVNIVIFAFLAALISQSVELTMVNIMIVNLITTLLAFFLIAHLYYFVILIKQKYTMSISNLFNTNVSKKIQETDEQLIMGINKFY